MTPTDRRGPQPPHPPPGPLRSAPLRQRGGAAEPSTAQPRRPRPRPRPRGSEAASGAGSGRPPRPPTRPAAPRRRRRAPHSPRRGRYAGGPPRPDTCPASPGQGGPPARSRSLAAGRRRRAARPGPVRFGPESGGGRPRRGGRCGGSREGRPDGAGGAEALGGAVPGRGSPTLPPSLPHRDPPGGTHRAGSHLGLRASRGRPGEGGGGGRDRAAGVGWRSRSCWRSPSAPPPRLPPEEQASFCAGF